MGIFAFPRIHVKGLIAIDSSTANNNSFANDRFPEGSPHAGEPLRLADTVNVRPMTYGMSDRDWIAWVQAPHPFEKGGFAAATASAQGPSAAHAAEAAPAGAASQTTPRTSVVHLPADWNYYGDMGLEMLAVRVIGVAYPGRLATDPGDEPLIGAELSFKNRPGPTGRSVAMMIDLNPEDISCTQIFSDSLTLEKDGRSIFSGRPTKAVTRWLNFQRNSALLGSNGAGCLFHCAVPAAALEGREILDVLSQGHPPGAVRGLVFRSYVYRAFERINVYNYIGERRYEEQAKLYAKGGSDPAHGEVIGTVAPWLAGEPESSPVGRIMNPTASTIPVPGGKGNGTDYQLAPAVFQVDRRPGLVSVDFSGTFPDAYANPAHDPLQATGNPKLDFGPVNLVVSDGGRTHDFGPVPYRDADAADRRGWIFDFPLAGLSPETVALVEAGSFSLRLGASDLLAEDDYLIVSDQACIYGEQGAAASAFMNQGADPVPATVRVYRRGVELSPGECPDLTVWEYDTTPGQALGVRVEAATGFRPGHPLPCDLGRPGARLYTFTVAGRPEPPPDYASLSLTTIPMINLRVLSNDRDYSRYYRDPSAVPPVGNEALTFEVIYEEVLRNYHLLYPAMSRLIPLDDPRYWADAEMAGRLLQRTQKGWFGRSEYMPRTRDLSDSRRTLLHAWCLKYLMPDA